MTPAAPSMDALLQKVRQAIALLHEAERLWPDSLSQALGDTHAPEAARLEDLWHEATHETVTALSFQARDISRLLACVQVRQQFGQFSTAQFDRIAHEGWSVPLVAQLQQQLPDMSAVKLSGLVKALVAAWHQAQRDEGTQTWINKAAADRRS